MDLSKKKYAERPPPEPDCLNSPPPRLVDRWRWPVGGVGRPLQLPPALPLPFKLLDLLCVPRPGAQEPIDRSRLQPPGRIHVDRPQRTSRCRWRATWSETTSSSRSLPPFRRPPPSSSPLQVRIHILRLRNYKINVKFARPAARRCR